MLYTLLRNTGDTLMKEIHFSFDDDNEKLNKVDKPEDGNFDDFDEEDESELLAYTKQLAADVASDNYEDEVLDEPDGFDEPEDEFDDYSEREIKVTELSGSEKEKQPQSEKTDIHFVKPELVYQAEPEKSEKAGHKHKAKKTMPKPAVNKPVSKTAENIDISEDYDDAEIHIPHVANTNIRKNIFDRKQQRKRRIKKAAKIIGVIIVAAGIFMVSPVFSVNEIIINDMHYFTKDEICETIGLHDGVNGFLFNKGKAAKLLEENPYISKVEISFILPDKMTVSVSENKICGYIKYLGSYLYIDRYGNVIDIKSETAESLPIIEGLKFDSFTIGSEIPVTNTDSFDAALSVSNSMSKYGVLNDAVNINVSDTDNIYAYIRGIRVLLGSNTRMDEKIKTMAEAVKEIPEGDKGTLDLSDLNKPIIFKYAT